MPTTATKPVYVVLHFWVSNGVEWQGIERSLMLVTIDPPSACIGFLPVYTDPEHLVKFHQGQHAIPFIAPRGIYVPAVLYSSRDIFPKAAPGFMIVYGTLAALRRQFPDPRIEYLTVDLPCPDHPASTLYLATGEAPGSPPASTPEQTGTPLAGLNTPRPNWLN